MNKTIVVAIGIVVTGLLIGYYIYSNKPRINDNVPVAKGINTADLLLTEDEQKTFYNLSNKGNLTEDENRRLEHPRKSLIWRIERSFALNKKYTVGEIIKKALEQQKGDFRIIAWETKGIDKQTILVNYSFARDGKFPGWYFEAKSGGMIIREISSDKELMEKYNVVKYTGLTDEEVVELNKLSRLYKPIKISGTSKSSIFDGKHSIFADGKWVGGQPVSADNERFHYLEYIRTQLTQQSLLVPKQSYQ